MQIRLFQTTDLLNLNAMGCLWRIFRWCFPIFILTLCFSILGVIDPAHTRSVFEQAALEHLAIQTIRILSSTAFLCFSVCIFFDGVRFISNPVRWFGGVVAEMCFGLFSTFIGFMIGMLPLAIYYFGLRSIVNTPDQILMALMLQYVLWFGVKVAYLEWPHEKKNFIYKLVLTEASRKWWGLLYFFIGFFLMAATLFWQ